MFFTFPEDARWPSSRLWSSGRDRRIPRGVTVPRRVSQRLLKAYYLQRTVFGSIAERKLRQRT
jgi:hypothetical protein